MWLQRGLAAAGKFADTHPALCILYLAVCFLPTVILQSYTKPLVNDEIYTVHISQAQTLRAMWGLEREIDLHPPLHYLAQREALRIPAPRWFTARLPSIVAGLFASVALFAVARRRFSALYGMVAVFLLWFSPALDQAWNNRPYMLWLAFLCGLVWLRDYATEQGRAAWVAPAIFVCTVCMVGTHLIGIACLLPFWMAELLRIRSRRTLDWAYSFAITAPALLGLEFYYQMHHLAANAFPSSQLPDLGFAVDIYVALVGNAAAILSGIILAVLLFVFMRTKRVVLKAGDEDFSASSGMRHGDLVLFIGLLLLPALLMIVSRVANMQFWTRYGTASTPAVAVLGAWLLACRLPFSRLLALLMVVAGTAYMAYVMVIDTPPASNAGMVILGRKPIPLASLDASLPIVAASPMTFMEMSDRESLSISSRVFYLTDVNSAYEFAHYTLFENEDKIRRLLQLPSQNDDLQHFLATHDRFYMVGDYNRSEVWLPRKLAASGLKLDYLGKFESSYESDDLYLVSH